MKKNPKLRDRHSMQWRAERAINLYAKHYLYAVRLDTLHITLMKWMCGYINAKERDYILLHKMKYTHLYVAQKRIARRISFNSFIDECYTVVGSN